MRTRNRAIAALLSLLLCLVTALGQAQPAQAATGYTLVAGGARTTTSAKAIKLKVTVRNNGKAVRKAKVWLQYRSGEQWLTEKKLTVRRGKGAVSVKHTAMERTYRFYADGKAASAPFTVHFLPVAFTISGSGWGHGVGMAQYGAYELARRGLNAESILATYYQGSALGLANNNQRTIKVQVLGPPADSPAHDQALDQLRGFTVGDGTTTLATTAAKKPVTIAVKGSKVTARVKLAGGRTKTVAAARLWFGWSPSSTVSVAGAHGAYRAGNLQATVIGGRPNLVNELRMNTDYLYGIDEMPSSWGSPAATGLEALKAQAIAARSYVITKALAWNPSAGGVNPACDCQVFDDSRSQNFTGWKKAGGAGAAYWRAAVDQTMNAAEVQVVRPSPTSAGQIAETTYFSSSGSFTADGVAYSGTASSTDAFGSTPIAYLSHVEDPYSAQAPGNPNRGWTRKLSQADLAKLFGIGQLQSIAVTERYAGGLVKSLTATAATGRTRTLTRTSEAWRTGLGLPAWVAAITAR